MTTEGLRQYKRLQTESLFLQLREEPHLRGTAIQGIKAGNKGTGNIFTQETYPDQSIKHL